MKDRFVKDDMPAERRTTSVRSAAAQLGMSANHLYSAIKRGEFPHIKVGQRVVVPTSALDRMLEGRTA